MKSEKNIILAIVISAIFLVFWSLFIETPKEKKRQAWEEYKNKVQQEKQQRIIYDAANNKPTYDTAIVKSERINIKNNHLTGSISLKGLRIDDLLLNDYKETLAKDSLNARLLAPVGNEDQYFIDFGWLSSDKMADVPTPNSIWSVVSKNSLLSPGNPVTFQKKSASNLLFEVEMSIDENYLINIEQKVINNSNNKYPLRIYGRIDRRLYKDGQTFAINHPGKEYSDNEQNIFILHEGYIGEFNDILEEIRYEDVLIEKEKTLAKYQQNINHDPSKTFHSKGGWLGISDKYWLTAIIPDNKISFEAKFKGQYVNDKWYQYYAKNKYGQDTKEKDIYQKHRARFVGEEKLIYPGEKITFKHEVFVGAKKVKLLDQYAEQLNIKFFDRAVDFGWFYFITKPMFLALSFLNHLFGNYGIAIIAFTALIRIALFPMANKSYIAMAKLKELAPKMTEIRKNTKDKMLAHREIITLYKKEGVNPASGFLLILVQIPIFFSLYKVLFVTIDMRHAPFFGWIHDLSAPDPTSIFNLFGLLPFAAPGGFLSIGVWPILMGLTMVMQQKLTPHNFSDPMQAKIMKALPYVLIFLFASFPAGLLIYWTFNNLLSVIQQYYITKKVTVKK